MDQLAKAIKLAVNIREKSFDHKQAQSKGPDYDFSKCYKLTLEDACKEAASICGFDTRGTTPVYLLLKSNWNDILKWAERFEEL